MFALTISSEDAGKTMREILNRVQQLDNFEQKLGSPYADLSCMVTLDDNIVPYPDLDTATVQEGQSFKVYLMVAGG